MYLTNTYISSNIKGMNANTQTLEKFVVTRDGEIDDNYYDQLYIEKRKDALKQVGREALHGTMTTAITVSKHLIEFLSTPAGGYPEQTTDSELSTINTM